MTNFQDPHEAALSKLLKDCLPEPSQYQPPEGLQDRLYRPTANQLRRDHKRGSIRRAGLIGLAYAAGLVTMFFWPDLSEQSPGSVVSQLSTPMPVPADSSVAQPTARPVRAADWEARAAVAPFEERAKMLRSAADAYLTEEGDISSALRCYRQYRGLVPASEFQKLDERDTWLLLSLRQHGNSPAPETNRSREGA